MCFDFVPKVGLLNARVFKVYLTKFIKILVSYESRNWKIQGDIP